MVSRIPDIFTYEELLPRPQRADRQFRGVVRRAYAPSRGELLYDVEIAVAATERLVTLRRVRESVPAGYPNAYTLRKAGDIVIVHRISRTAWEIVASVEGSQDVEDGDNPATLLAPDASVSVSMTGVNVSAGGSGLAVTHSEVLVTGDGQTAAIRVGDDELTIAARGAALQAVDTDYLELVDTTLALSDDITQFLTIDPDDSLELDTSASRTPGADSAASRTSTTASVGDHGSHSHTTPDHYHYVDLAAALDRSTDVGARIRLTSRLVANDNALVDTTAAALTALAAPDELTIAVDETVVGGATIRTYAYGWDAPANPDSLTLVYDMRFLTWDILEAEAAAIMYGLSVDMSLLVGGGVGQQGIMGTAITLRSVVGRSQDLSLADRIVTYQGDTVALSLPGVDDTMIRGLQFRGFQVRARSTNPPALSAWSAGAYQVGYMLRPQALLRGV